MKKVYARGFLGKQKVLAFVKQEGGTVLVCPVDKYNPNSMRGSLEFAVGFPVEDISEEAFPS